jgi:VWFA-related protein
LIFLTLFFVTARLLMVGQHDSAKGTPSVTSADQANHIIALNVQVTDKSGSAVRGLQPQDFSLLINGKPEKFVSVEAIDHAGSGPTQPLEVLLVVDAVNTGFANIADVKLQVKRFLSENGGKLAYPLELAVVTDSGVNLQNGFSRDGNALISIFDQYKIGLTYRPAGFYGAQQLFNYSFTPMMSMAQYASKVPGRKFVIWISPGWPELAAPHYELYGKGQQQVFQWIVDASNALRKANVTVYDVDPRGALAAGTNRISYYKHFLRPVAEPRQAQAGNLALQVIAVQSGGEVFAGTNELSALIDECLKDAESYYVLSFNAPAPTHANEYEAVAVNVSKPGAVVRTRMGYYDQP